MSLEYPYMQGSNSRWNGRDSIEITIPELKRVNFLTFIETVCIGISTVILSLSLLVFILSLGFERSDIGSIIFAGTALVAFLIVVAFTDAKLNETVKVVDHKFNEAIKSQLGLQPVDNATVAHKKSGYMYLTDGTNVTMWEIYYYPDESDLITLERYIPESLREAPSDNPFKAA
jgi:hypothetical protein